MDRAYSFPIIHVEATRSCNLHCGICMAGCNDPGVRERSAQAELTYQEIVERILKPGRKLGARHIQYSGGEFLLRNDALDLIRAAAALGYAPRVLTNGTLITEELLAEIKRVGGPQFVLVFGLNSVIGERLNLGTRDVGREVVFRALDLCKRHRVGRHVVVNVGSYNARDIEPTFQWLAEQRIPFNRSPFCARMSGKKRTCRSISTRRCGRE
jgi:MoaA/NifB/PqqE/SkfB family radical SAM enzyme